MANLTSVTLTAGVPTAGTGTVGTIDNVTGTAGTPSTAVLTVQGVASGTAQPVTLASTTITGTAAVTQSGTWTVQPGNTANTTAWKVDGSAVTQPVSGTVTANIGTGVTKAAGAADATTLRVTVDSGQMGTLGSTTASASVPVVPATDWVGSTSLSKFGTGFYVTVAASQTATVLQSSTGTTGDYVSGVLVIPATTSPGNVLLLDNATSITIFTGGATSVTNLVPFFIPLGAVSRSGAWKLTTGANVSCVAIGKFS